MIIDLIGFSVFNPGAMTFPFLYIVDLGIECLHFEVEVLVDVIEILIFLNLTVFVFVGIVISTFVFFFIIIVLFFAILVWLLLFKSIKFDCYFVYNLREPVVVHNSANCLSICFYFVIILFFFYIIPTMSSQIDFFVCYYQN